MLHITPARFSLLMRRHHWTIRTLAAKAGVTHDRIRRLLAQGIFANGRKRQEVYCHVCDWFELITGRVAFNRDRYERMAIA